MGVAANGFCHATAEDAALHACGTLYPLSTVGVAGDGSVVTAVVQCSSVSGTAMTLERVRDGVSLGDQTVAFVGAPCDEMVWLTYTPFSLTAEQGSVLACAIVAVWGVGWAWKAIAKTLNAADDAASE